MKNILWLTSWYPNDFDKGYANFIQRQAVALSKYCRVYVLYLHPVADDQAPYAEDHIVTNNFLTEHIVYYRVPEPNNWFGKLISMRRYMKLALQRYKQFVELYGQPDYLHAQVPVRAGVLARHLSRKYKIPYALTEHYGIYNNEVVDPFVKRSAFYQRQAKRVIADANPLVVVSTSLGEDIHQIACKKDFTVVHNVVDTTIFRHQDVAVGELINFIHVSNMIPLKNVEGIIDAFKIVHKMLPSTRMTIAGRKSDAVLEHALNSGLTEDVLIFTGEVEYNQVADLMQQSAALVMFSNTESMSCVVAEALCCGLPVISTPTGIARDVIQESNGILVPKRDVKQLADAMYRIATGQFRYNRNEISQKAIAIYNYDSIGRQLSAVYQQKSTADAMLSKN